MDYSSDSAANNLDKVSRQNFYDDKYPFNLIPPGVDPFFDGYFGREFQGSAHESAYDHSHPGDLYQWDEDDYDGDDDEGTGIRY